MTEMKRTTVSFPDEIVEEIERLKSTTEYGKCTYSEIIRKLVLRGLSVEDDEGERNCVNTKFFPDMTLEELFQR